MTEDTRSWRGQVAERVALYRGKRQALAGRRVLDFTRPRPEPRPPLLADVAGPSRGLALAADALLLALGLYFAVYVVAGGWVASLLEGR